MFYLGYQQFLSTCAIIRLEQNYARPKISGTCFSLFVSLFFFHLIIDSHPIPNSAGREFSTPTFLFSVCEAGHGNDNATYEVVFPGKKSSWVYYGYGGGNDG